MNGLVALPYAWNTKGGSITVPLTSFLTGLESAALQLKNYIHVFICNADYFKPVKQEVNGTVTLPPCIIPCPMVRKLLTWVGSAQNFRKRQNTPSLL
jgi:hypothetical protein